MVLDRPGSLLDLLQAVAHCLGQPPLPAPLGPGPAGVMPKGHDHLLDRTDPGRFKRAASQHLEP